MNKWEPAAGALPRHVAIIMDGNRRWAKKQGLPSVFGHRKGVEALRGVIRESSDLGIQVLSLYAFSTENWKRSTEEVSALMGLLLEFFGKEIDALDQNQVKIRIIGNIAGLPKAQREAALRAMERTQRNKGLQLNIALNYGGRDEIRRAFLALHQKINEGSLAPSEITEQVIASVLDTAGQPDVDLLVRPSGEMRLSNFLLYQCAYAEFVFSDTLWPDFTIDQYHQALDSYASRERRLGGEIKRKKGNKDA